MDKLRTILSTLSPLEQKELSGFVQRQKPGKSRKDLELLRLLQGEKDLSAADMVQSLYPESENQVAYHALRKRLIRQISDFIVLKRRDEDPTNASQIMGFISLANHLFDKRADQLAWEIIRKAEKIARSHEQFDLLNAIYNVQIEHAEGEFAEELDAILEKRNANKARADEDERARIASSIINQKLAEVRLKGKDLNFDETIQTVLETYQLTEAVSQRPRLLYNLMFIARSAVLAKKDYYTFEPYVIGMYESMGAGKGFSKAHHPYKIRLIYMIAHVLYRNKKFEESVRYLKELHEALQAHQSSYYPRFYPRYALLLAANYSFLYRLDEAISILEDLLETQSASLKAKDALNARLNLCLYYYQRGNFQQVVQCSLGFTHSDKWMEKKMGKEWVIKRNLSEIMFQIDLGNLDLALNKIRSLERNYRLLIQQEDYEKAHTFLQLLKQLIRQPKESLKPAFYQQIRQSFAFTSMEREDLQEVNFYAWLKYKVTGGSFTEILQELVRRKGEPEIIGD